MQNIHLRAATIEDLPILLEFEQGIVQAEIPFNPMLKTSGAHYYDLAAYVESPDVEVLVATVAGEIVASAYAKEERSKAYEKQDKHALMGFMYVKPEHRGKGINKLLVEALFEWVRARGLKEVRLTVYSDNAPAIRAYEKVGFSPLLLEMRMELD